jgi:hypothetical protein
MDESAKKGQKEFEVEQREFRDSFRRLKVDKYYHGVELPKKSKAQKNKEILERQQKVKKALERGIQMTPA